MLIRSTRHRDRPLWTTCACATRISCHPVEAARALESLGLAARSSGGTDRYVAFPPSVALAALAVQREEELRRAQREIDSLAEVYRGTDTERSVSDVVDVVRGAKAVGQRFAELQMSAREEVLGVRPGRDRGGAAGGEQGGRGGHPGSALPRSDRAERRVRALMDLVSADTRLQLGFHAAPRGWI